MFGWDIRRCDFGRLVLGMTLAVIACAPSAATAQAATRAAVARGPVTGGPFLAGPGVAWYDETCGFPCDLNTDFFYGGTDLTLRAKLPGRRVFDLDSELIDLPSDREPDEGPFTSAFVSGAWSVNARSAKDAVTLTAGRLGAKKRETLVACTTSGETDAFDHTLLREGLVAYAADPCKPGGPLRVRNLATGAPGPSVEPGGLPVAVSATHLASVVGGGSVLRTRDWRTGAQLGPDRAVPAGQEVESADLDADGSVAAVFFPKDPKARCQAQVVVYPPTAASGTQLTDRGCSGAPVRLDGGRAAYMVERGPSYQVLEADSAGATRTLVRFSGAVAGGFDADATTVAFASRRCDGRSDLLRSLRAGPPYAEGAASCPVRLPSRVRVRGRSAFLRVGCPRGCRGTLALRRGNRRLAVDTFAATRSGRIRFRLSRRERSRLARSRGPLTLRAATLNRGGDTVRQSRRISLRR